MRNIVLVCSAGVTTSMLVQRMQAAADAQGYECHVHAHPVADVDVCGKDADIVLLGPQVKFRLNEVKSKVSCPAEVIAPMEYGQMNGEKVLARVKEVLHD